MVDRASVGEFKEGMGFIHLLQICLQESSRHNAPKHDKSGFGRVATGAMDSRKDPVDLGMVVEGGVPS